MLELFLSAIRAVAATDGEQDRDSQDGQHELDFADDGQYFPQRVHTNLSGRAAVRLTSEFLDLFGQSPCELWPMRGVEKDSVVAGNPAEALSDFSNSRLCSINVLGSLN